VPHATHSAKFFFLFLEPYFAECHRPGTRQNFSFYFYNLILPSATGPALGKIFLFIFRTLFCRVLQVQHSAKFFFYFYNLILPSATGPALGKIVYLLLKTNFAECLQETALGKEYFAECFRRHSAKYFFFLIFDLNFFV